MKKVNKRVLILSLYSGENEYEESKKSVKEQNYEYIEYRCFENLPNKEAHDRLYKTIMDESSNFDIFIKLDADMILEEKDFILKVVSYFIENDNVDLLSYTVLDYFTNTRIWGINCFSNRCKWNVISENLFVDHQPSFNGKKIKIVDENNMVSHAKNPSFYQSYMFGFHRALKVVQKDRKTPLLGHSYGQYNTLNKLIENYISNNKEVLKYAILGAFTVFNKDYTICENKLKYLDVYNEEIKKINQINVKKISIISFIDKIGYYRFIKSIILYIQNKMKNV